MTHARRILAAAFGALALFQIAAADPAAADGQEIRKDITVEVFDQSNAAATHRGALTTGNGLRQPQSPARVAPKARDFLIQQGVPIN